MKYKVQHRKSVTHLSVPVYVDADNAEHAIELVKAKNITFTYPSHPHVEEGMRSSEVMPKQDWGAPAS